MNHIFIYSNQAMFKEKRWQIQYCPVSLFELLHQPALPNTNIDKKLVKLLILFNYPRLSIA